MLTQKAFGKHSQMCEIAYSGIDRCKRNIQKQYKEEIRTMS